MAKKTEEYDPSLTGIILTAVLGSFLGLILAGINTVFLPIKTVKELPALEDREKKMVYYVPGDKKNGSTWKVKSRAYMQQNVGTLILTEGELNTWSRNSFKPDLSNKDEGGRFGFKMKINAPNFRISGGEFQISAKMDVSVMGKSGSLIYQSTGSFYNMGGSHSYHADSGFLGSCPIPTIADLPNRIFNLFMRDFLGSETSGEFSGPWNQLNDVLVEGNRLKLVR